MANDGDGDFVPSVARAMQIYGDKHGLALDYSEATVGKIVGDRHFNRTKRRLLGVTLRDLEAESRETRDFVSQKLLYEIKFRQLNPFFMHIVEELNSAQGFVWPARATPLAILAYFQDQENITRPIEEHFVGIMLTLRDERDVSVLHIDSLAIWEPFQKLGLGERAVLMLELLVRERQTAVKSIELVPAESAASFWRHKLGFRFKWDVLDQSYERIIEWRRLDKEYDRAYMAYWEQEAARLQELQTRRQRGEPVQDEALKRRPFMPPPHLANLQRPAIAGLDWFQLNNNEQRWTMVKYLSAMPASSPF